MLANESVLVYRGRADDLGERARRVARKQVHLEEAHSSVEVALGVVEVVGVLGVDVGHEAVVELHGDRATEPG